MEKKYLIATFLFLLICLFIISFIKISKDWDWYNNLIILGIMISLALLMLLPGLKNEIREEKRTKPKIRIFVEDKDGN